jgi:predicted amidohydrolase YtcJ
VAVNRSLPAPAGGGGEEPFLPGQALSLESVLAAYTSGSARINGLETVSGSIAEGLDADLAVLDADLSRRPARDIGQASVTQTWVRGELGYEKGVPG